MCQTSKMADDGSKSKKGPTMRQNLKRVDYGPRLTWAKNKKKMSQLRWLSNWLANRRVERMVTHRSMTCDVVEQGDC